MNINTPGIDIALCARTVLSSDWKHEQLQRRMRLGQDPQREKDSLQPHGKRYLCLRTPFEVCKNLHLKNELFIKWWDTLQFALRPFQFVIKLFCVQPFLFFSGDSSLRRGLAIYRTGFYSFVIPSFLMLLRLSLMAHPLCKTISVST